MEESKNFPADPHGKDRSARVSDVMADKIKEAVANAAKDNPANVTKGKTLEEQITDQEKKGGDIAYDTRGWAGRNAEKRPDNLKHAEAFCHMQYFARNGRASVQLTIWNSRDGVTPMFMHLDAFPGLQFSHVNFQNDSYDPDYKPKKGDYIWRTWRDEEIKEFAAQQFDRMVSEELPALEKMTDEQIEAKFRYDAREHLREIIKKGRENWIETTFKNYGGRGEPHLELVAEDWK